MKERHTFEQWVTDLPAAKPLHLANDLASYYKAGLLQTGEIYTIDPESLELDDRNRPVKATEALVHSILRSGYIEGFPIIGKLAWRKGKLYFVVFDGQHRRLAAMLAEVLKVPIMIVKDVDWLALALANSVTSKFDEIEKAEHWSKLGNENYKAFLGLRETMTERGLSNIKHSPLVGLLQIGVVHPTGQWPCLGKKAHVAGIDPFFAGEFEINFKRQAFDILAAACKINMAARASLVRKVNKKSTNPICTRAMMSALTMCYWHDFGKDWPFDKIVDRICLRASELEAAKDISEAVGQLKHVACYKLKSKRPDFSPLFDNGANYWRNLAAPQGHVSYPNQISLSNPNP